MAIETDELVNLKNDIQDLKGIILNLKVQDVYSEVMTTEQALKYLKVSIRTLQLLRDTGKVKFSQDGRMIRYRKADLDDYLNEYRVGR